MNLIMVEIDLIDLINQLVKWNEDLVSDKVGMWVVNLFCKLVIRITVRPHG